MKYIVKRFSQEAEETHPPLPDLKKIEASLWEEGYSGREIGIIIDELRSLPPEEINLENIASIPEVKWRMEKYGLSPIAAWIETKTGLKRHGHNEDYRPKT